MEDNEAAAADNDDNDNIFKDYPNKDDGDSNKMKNKK